MASKMFLCDANGRPKGTPEGVWMRKHHSEKKCCRNYLSTYVLINIFERNDDLTFYIFRSWTRQLTVKIYPQHNIFIPSECCYLGRTPVGVSIVSKAGFFCFVIAATFATSIYYDFLPLSLSLLVDRDNHEMNAKGVLALALFFIQSKYAF